MILSTEITVIDQNQNILDINVNVEWWVKAGQPSSRLDPGYPEEIIIESIIDDTGYDWSDELSRDVMTMIRKQCKAELEE